MKQKNRPPSKKIVILGSGGNCVDILDTLMDINDAHDTSTYDCIGFLDDNPKKWGMSYHDVKVLGPLEKVAELLDCFFVFGIGSTSNFWKRHEILSRIGILEERFETVIHPTASISRMSHVGLGSVILQHVTINNSVQIGKHVYILPNSVVSHDSIIDDFSCIAAGVTISGSVHVGRSCYLGAGSTIREGLTIGDSCLVGMGSTVLKNVPENNVVVGNPARFLRHTRPAQT